MNVHASELGDLIGHRDPTCISIYCPVEVGGYAEDENRARLAGLVRRAAASLPDDQGQQLIPSLEALLDSDSFWRQRSAGVALFRSSTASGTHWLPFAPEPLAVVGEHFHITPLFQAFEEPRRYFVLALRRDGLRLVEVDHGEATERDVREGFPASLESGAWTAEASGARAGDAPRSPERGERQRAASSEPDLERYMRAVDRSLRVITVVDPVVLVGPPDLTEAFRRVCAFPQPVVPGDVVVATDEMSAAEIADAAHSRVREALVARREDVAIRVAELAHTSRVSASLPDILTAAEQGRVDALFVPRASHAWEPDDADEHPDSGEFECAETPRHDLLNLAAARAFVRGADIFVVEPDELPLASDRPVAFMRY